ncbi:Protein GVQW3 [Anthophora plagiata]
MKELEEQRVCVKFCFKLRKSATEIFRLIQKAFGHDSMSRTKCFEWYNRFKSGRISMDEDTRSGRFSTLTTRPLTRR